MVFVVNNGDGDVDVNDVDVNEEGVLFVEG